MGVYVFIGYLVLAGVVATADFSRHGGKVGLLRCFLLALSFPIHIVNLVLALFYSLFGIVYIPVVKYVTVVEGDIKATLENQLKDLEELEKVTKDDNTPLQ